MKDEVRLESHDEIKEDHEVMDAFKDFVKMISNTLKEVRVSDQNMREG